MIKLETTLLATVALGSALVSAATASAAITITQGTSAPTYSHLLTFDEPGAATGVNVAANSYAAYGLASIISGEGSNYVGDNSPATGFNTTNSFYGPFGVFMEFGQDLSSASLQVWDSSGPSSPFGGGAAIAAFKDGNEVASLFFDPAFAGIGDEWFNITTSGGDTFDEIRVLGFGFPADTYVDNVSWNVAPAPGAFALLGVAGLVGGRRRRG